MKHLFLMAIGLESGGPEDGMMCSTHTDIYDCEVNLFQPIEDMFREVEQKYTKEFGDDPQFIGCKVKRIFSLEEERGIRALWAWEDAHCIDGNVYV